MDLSYRRDNFLFIMLKFHELVKILLLFKKVMSQSKPFTKPNSTIEKKMSLL